MRPEIESAANFLSNLLRLHSDVLSGDQFDLFRISMEGLLSIHYQHHWFPEKPFKGSGYRCLRINHKMDPMIAKAGIACGLDESALRTYFPNELTMWIDPKEVSYRIGENGSICVLFDSDTEESSSNRKGDAKADTHNETSSNRSANYKGTNRVNTASPSASSLSSTTSTLSSPSPSLSPDFCYRERSPITPNGHHQTSHESNSGYLNTGYSINSNAVNVPHTRGGMGYNNGYHCGNSWSPSRIDNPNGYHGNWYKHQPQQQHGRRHNQAPISPVSHHNQGFSNWDSFFLEQTGRHFNVHHNSHLNANLEQLAAYVSS